MSDLELFSCRVYRKIGGNEPIKDKTLHYIYGSEVRNNNSKIARNVENGYIILYGNVLRLSE